MQKLITLILPIAILFSVNTQAQVIADAGELKSSLTKGDIVIAAKVKPAKDEPQWKVSNVTERREFYAVKAAFDPSGEYESLYGQSQKVQLGVSKKSESGIARLMSNNNSAPSAYYNNAAIGTILKITNPHNGKTTYAVVVGKIPPADSSSYMLILSERVSRSLSIKDYSSVDLICYTGD
jgi:hypothetical protein